MPYIPGPSHIYYEERGEGPPVMLLHGVGGNHASWFNQVPLLTEQYRSIVFDHRGFGNSDDDENLGREAYVDDIARFLDARQIDRLVLVGQSMGAGAAAAFTCKFPDRVHALIHCDSLAGVVLPEPYASALKATNAATRDLPQVERVLGPRIRASSPELTLLYLQIASFNRYVFKTVPGVSTPWTPEALRATGRPVLFIVGEDDNIAPPELVRAMSRLAGAPLVTIRGAGHSAYFERPEAFNQILVDFLDALPPW